MFAFEIWMNEFSFVALFEVDTTPSLNFLFVLVHGIMYTLTLLISSIERSLVFCTMFFKLTLLFYVYILHFKQEISLTVL